MILSRRDWFHWSVTGLGGAALLHLLGIDHERLTFYHNGIRRRLTDVSATW